MKASKSAAAVVVASTVAAVVIPSSFPKTGAAAARAFVALDVSVRDYASCIIAKGKEFLADAAAAWSEMLKNDKDARQRVYRSIHNRCAALRADFTLQSRKDGSLTVVARKDAKGGKSAKGAKSGGAKKKADTSPQAELVRQLEDARKTIAAQAKRIADLEATAHAQAQTIAKLETADNSTLQAEVDKLQSTIELQLEVIKGLRNGEAPMVQPASTSKRARSAKLQPAVHAAA